ncbi:hypothetical protein BHF71_09570 [Vulcanibacillus modesticaldus]|uniref:SHOCT domain-containing protein n=1 Tax=Vulcanibacillus modesticaldus TaxID=337097 RepID=A0A1D2YU41_9BACI|nr:SHOCT domain-containing protein [Vulcanibacillus modesticaldus]OEF99230.1 hypothetical protein BHF71_09570 [Vulcanibacillus modesticaldus]
MWPGYGNFADCGIGGGFGVMFFSLILIGVIIYFVLKNSNRNGSIIGTNKTGSSDALEIAKQRLAKGEITPEEFEEIKKNLL